MEKMIVRFCEMANSAERLAQEKANLEADNRRTGGAAEMGVVPDETTSALKYINILAK